MGQADKKRCRFCRKPLLKPGYCSDVCHAKFKRVFIAAWYRTKRYAWSELREWVLIRDRFQCGFCGKPVTMETANIDHIRPWKYGGKTNAYNLHAICRDCNKAKCNRPAYALADEVGVVSPRLVKRVKKQARMRKRWHQYQEESAVIREAEAIVDWLWP